MLRQVHSDLVWRDPEPGRAGDGLMTDRPGVLLGIRTADCCPVLLVDTRRRAVAAVHAGWRGTLARVAEKAVGEMRAAYGTRPADVRAAIGPCIGACCFEVGPEVVEAFLARFAGADDLFSPPEPDWLAVRYPNLFLTSSPPGHLPEAPQRRLDLAAAQARQLAAAGVPAGRIERVGGCTACEAGTYYSHRRRREAGRQLSAVGLASPS